MATTLIGEKRIGSGGIRLNGQAIEFVETYMYIVDGGSSSETRNNVLSTTGLPIVGTSTLASGAVCISKQAERSDVNPRWWEVTCEYASQNNNQSQQDPNNPSQDPTTWIPVYKIDYETDQVAVTKFYGVSNATHPIVNSAAQVFSTPLVKNQLIAVYRFSQFESDSLSEKTIMDRNDNVNSGVFKGFPKWSLKLNVLGCERGYYNGYAARKIDYMLSYKEGWAPSTWHKPSVSADVVSYTLATEYSGWREMVLDVGIWEINAGKREGNIDDTGYRIECGLDGAGQQVPVTEYPAVLGIPIFKEVNFSSFLRT